MSTARGKPRQKNKPLGTSVDADQEMEALLSKSHPLVQVFAFEADLLLVYDAKPHLACILSRDEWAVLAAFLQERPIEEIHAPSLDAGVREVLLEKYRELKSAGVFLEGPAEEVSPVAPEAVREQLRYFDENILLRKFCIGVTEDCNYRCTYCRRTITLQYDAPQPEPLLQAYLSEENAFRAVDYYFERYTGFLAKLTPEKRQALLETVPPTLSWYGGEPFLNFPLMRSVTAYFQSLPWEQHGVPADRLRVSSNTNLSLLTDEMIEFIIGNRVLLFASLDGPEQEHDRCRVFSNGKGTFATAFRNLMRIKEADPDYFRTCVALFAVATPEHNAQKCIQFNASLGAFRSERFEVEYKGVFADSPEATLEHLRATGAQRLESFKVKAREADGKEEVDFGNFSGLFPFSQLQYDHPSGSQSLRLLLTCPMGFDNLMVAANGDYLVCHKVDGSMPIGNCRSGLDMDRIAEVYCHYNATINATGCGSCWAVRFCNVCAATRMDNGRFLTPTPAECDCMREEIAFRFRCFIHLSREHPQLLERIFAYTRDPHRYVGVIDLNVF